MYNQQESPTISTSHPASKSPASFYTTFLAYIVTSVCGWLTGRIANLRQWLGPIALRFAVVSSLLVVLLSGILSQFANAGLGLIPTASAHGLASSAASQGTPNRFNPHSNASSVKHLPTYPATTRPVGPPQQILHPTGTMKPGQLVLTPGKAATFIGSDGVLELNVPATAVTATDLAAAGGSVGLSITQIAPAGGSNAGGSGMVSFGTYLIQVVDANGVLLTHGLHAPITAKLHYGKKASALDFTKSFVIFNGSLPLVGVTSAPVQAPNLRPHAPAHVSPSHGSSGPLVVPTTAAGMGLGQYNSGPVQFDPTAHTLSIIAYITTPSTSMTWNTDSPVASFGKPDPFNVDLNAGALNASYPIDLPAGPGNFTPPVSLSYSSESVAEQHAPQAATSWVGEGFNLSLGAITWAEHDVTANCVATNTCSATWEDSWQLSDPFGTSAELIPPNINYSTYFDDTPNAPYQNYIQWHTANESHAKIYSYINPSLALPDGGSDNPPCFRVFLTNGVMEEFGCTADSLEYYYTPGQGDYISSWNLDLITDPQGNQIQITYQQDVAQKKDSKGVNHTYIRDAHLATIEYDSPTCYGTTAAQTRCATNGTAPNLWQPLMRVNFVAGHTVTRLTNTPSGCNTGTNLRCDDPNDLTKSGGLSVPDVQTTYVLNDIQVQVRSSGTANWNNTLHDYQFAYEQTGPSQIQDGATGKQESVAGRLLLTHYTEVGDDSTTSMPTVAFAYWYWNETYVDSAFIPNPSTNCKFSWNTGEGNGCFLWNTSYDNNSAYLTMVSNGMGLVETFNYALARNNTHGVPSGHSASDPINGCPYTVTTYPCNAADDQNWSHVILTQKIGKVIRPASSGNVEVDSQTNYSYFLTTNLPAPSCQDCFTSMYWGNVNDGDYLDYYNNKFMGFIETDVNNPDGSIVKHHYYTTEGYGVYDTSQVSCFIYGETPCQNDPWWAATNAEHGHEFETDAYDTNGTTLLSKTTKQYQLTCPPSGVSGTPPWTGNPNYGNWKGNLVSELDHNNPVAVCDIQLSREDDYTYDGATGTVPQKTTTYAYDSYGRVTSTTVNTNNGGSLTGSPTVIVTTTAYIWHDSVTPSKNSVTGTYLINFPASTIVQDSGNTTHYSCSFTGYDSHTPTTGQWNWLTLGEVSYNDQYTNCGTSANSFATSGLIRSLHTYDVYGNQVTTDDPDAEAGNSTHLGCQIGGSTHYSTCNSFDTTFDALPTATSNALNQSNTTGYTATAAGGFGIWPTSTTDPNSQVTTYGYDALGRMTSQTLPGETSGDTTQSWTFTDWCVVPPPDTTPAAQAPCVEIDQTQRINSSTTMTTRAFYDGYGHLVETRTPAPGGNDVVKYREYDPSNRDIVDSISYFVSAYTGGPGSAAYSTPDATQPSTTTSYDGEGRTKTKKDALSNSTAFSYSVVTGYESGGAADEQATVIDPLGHEAATLTDSAGRKIEDRRFTGNGTTSSPYAFYVATEYVYDYNDDLTQIWQGGNTSVKTVFTFDAAKRQTGLTDPDKGTESYTLDADGNITLSIDGRGGSAGSVYAGYDGLNRPLWRNTSNTQSGAYVAYAYDSTANGNLGQGHLTSEAFTGGPNNSLSGSYSYVYDQRGRQINQILKVGSTPYSTQISYDDTDAVLTQTYPDGEIVTNNYSSQEWLSSLSVQQGSTSTTLLSNVSYSGVGGAAQLMTSATIGLLNQSSTVYDDVLHPTDSKLQYNNSTVFEEARTYDASGNVSTLNTTLPQGTDYQTFCYDEQNRLVWAGSVGTPTCTGTAITPGTLTAAQYTQTFSYDNYGRLTSGPLGSYTYGPGMQATNNPSPLHAALSIGTAYTATYDTAGNMTCRAPSNSATCSGTTPTGTQLNYDNEGRLIFWQDAPSASTTDGFLYDGEGHRVEQQVTTLGITTTNVYVGDKEQIQTSGSTTTTTTYYYTPGGQRIALAVNGVFSYLASSATLGSILMTLDGNGNVQATKLYAPYGNVRYSTNSLPTDYGFTGQHNDVTTGLDYYNARYYDPVAGQFVSADSVLPGKGFDPWGLSRYAYVEGNPETQGDPTGHCPECLIGAGIGLVLGLGIGIWAEASAGELGTGGGWAHVAADAGLGASAGLALSTDPGAWWGAGGAVLGLVLTNNDGHGWNSDPRSIQNAFEQVTLGADEGAVGDWAGGLLDGAKGVAGIAGRAFVQGAVGFASNVADQVIQNLANDWNHPDQIHINWTEAGVAGAFNGAGSLVSSYGKAISGASQATQEAFNNISNGISGIINPIAQYASDLTWGSNTMSDLGGDFADAADNLINQGANIVSDGLNNLGNMFGF